MSSLIIQLLNGLASASTLFLVAAGLSLIFGVTRIVNFAHGSLYMLGLYLAYSTVALFGGGALGFWGGIVCAAVTVSAVGTLIEILLLRRIYRAPEMLQLLATFGVALIANDFCLWMWGPEDLLGPRAPGLRDSMNIFGNAFPEYDLLMILVGPLVLGLLWLLLKRTRWGLLVRAATEDRDMAAALGINQKWLFTGVFALGSLLAGLGGALQLPREPAQLALDLPVVVDAFVVVIVGGLGSIPGAFFAALLIGEIKALCIAIGQFDLFGFQLSLTKATLAIEFMVMAMVLIARPRGLLGRRDEAPRRIDLPEESSFPFTDAKARFIAVVLLIVLALLPIVATPYAVILTTDILVFALFAASLHFLMGPGGMISFGHAAYFGLGCYGGALLLKPFGWPMEAALSAAPFIAGLGAAIAGWFCVRLSGVYLAMLTLAFAQIVWSSVYQWDGLTGGSNGMVGVWPAAWLESKTVFYFLALVLCVAGLGLMWRMLSAPFGYALRACRDSPLRCEAIGIDVRQMQWKAFIVAGLFAGLAGALYAFSKGSISPETLSIPRSVDALVMVMLGGVQSFIGPLAGAAAFTWLQDTVARNTNYWHALLGTLILAMALAFPRGIAGFVQERIMREPRA